MTNIKVMGIYHNSVVDGSGFREVIFTSGCPHHCKGCHNPETWNIDNGKLMSISDIIKALDSKSMLTFSGGEPFLQAQEIAELIREYSKLNNGLLNIWIYSGYTYEELIADKEKYDLLKLCDVLVDGKFDIDKKQYGLKFKGSSNQRIIDIKKSLQENKVVLWQSGAKIITTKEG